MIKEIAGYDFGLICDAEDQIPYGEKCMEYLAALPADVKKRLAGYLVDYYQEMESCLFEDELEEIGPVDENNVFDHIRITYLIVDSECRTDRIEFHVEGVCDWECEHGLEITISDDKILYVGPFEDNGPNSDRLRYALANFPRTGDEVEGY